MKFLSKRNWIITFTSILLACLMVLSGVQVGRTLEQKGSLTIGQGFPTIRIGMAGVAAAGTADYTCTGTNDDVIVQAALNSLPSNGGRLEFLAGNYSFSATVSRLIPNVTIQGVGKATSFTFDGAQPIFQPGGNNWVFKDFATDSINGINQGVTTGWIEENIWLGTLHYTFRSTDGETVAGSFSTENASITNFVNSPVPDANATRSWGSSIKKWLTGWFVNLVTDTLNATQVNGTTGNITTLHITSAGTVYYTDVYGTKRTFLTMGNTTTKYGYQSALYLGSDNGKSTSNASFQVAVGINGLSNSDNETEGNTGIGTAFLQGLRLWYNVVAGDGPLRFANDSRNNVALGDHTGYGTANDVDPGNVSFNSTVIVGSGGARTVQTGIASVLLGTGVASGSTYRTTYSVILGNSAASQESVLNYTLWIASDSTRDPLIRGTFPNTMLQFNANNVTVNGSSYFLNNLVVSNNLALQFRNSTGTAEDVLSKNNNNDTFLKSGTGDLYLNTSLDKNIFMWQGASGTGRSLIIDGTNANAGDTIKDSPTIALGARYWNGANIAWYFRILNDMTNNATASSNVTFSTNGTTWLIGENIGNSVGVYISVNGTMSKVYKGANDTGGTGYANLIVPN